MIFINVLRVHGTKGSNYHHETTYGHPQTSYEILDKCELSSEMYQVRILKGIRLFPNATENINQVFIDDFPVPDPEVV